MPKNFSKLFLSNRLRPSLNRLKGLIKNEKLSFWVILVSVFLILTFKGSTGDGQPTLFSNLIEQYAEETSSSIASYTHASQLAEISTLKAFNINDPGRGGQDVGVNPVPINDNSIMANTPTNMDYLDSGSFKKNQVVDYIVQPGDLLSFIASDYGVSMNSIIWANQLKDADNIAPGQTLKIPPVSGVIHKVKEGDTVASIAKKYNADQSKIIDFNGISPGISLEAGEEIIVPDGQMKIIPATMNTNIANVAGIPKFGTSTKNVNQRFSYLPDLGDYFMTPTTGYNWGRIHGRNGVDIANSCGTPEYSAADGTVTIADPSGYNGGFGKYIKINHPNGTETLYSHATKLLVSVGDHVQRGQIISLMGSTGRSTGCHLHFEVHGAKNPLAKY